MEVVNGFAVQKTDYGLVSTTSLLRLRPKHIVFARQLTEPEFRDLSEKVIRSLYGDKCEILPSLTNT